MTAKAIAFIVASAPNESHNVGHNHALWMAMDKTVEETPKNEQLAVGVDACQCPHANVRMHANACTGRRVTGGGTLRSKDYKVLGAYGRDVLNDNGELLLPFATNHDLALVNKFFSTLKGGVSHDFNG